MRSAEEIAALTSWHANWSGVRVAVLGLGMTGFSVADTLVELQARVLVVAGRADPRLEEMLSVIGAELFLATDQTKVPEDLEAFAPELIVVSPGFPPAHPFLAWAQRLGIPVWGDIELAWRLRDKNGSPAAWLAVTGTNGKTTTVQLAAAMIAASGSRVAACGNVGVPVLDAIRDPAGFDAFVVELSSFQLHYTHSMAPHSSVCLNIAEDHVDWHGSVAAYRAAKARVYENTEVACIYNIDDEVTRQLVEQADVQEGCRAIGFGAGVPGPSDLGIVDGILCDRAFLDERRDHALEIVTLGELRSLGLGAPHIVADVLAASAIARSFGTPINAVRAALDEFHPDHHRAQEVAQHAGIRWVDDSKATNPHAARASLAAHDSVVWVIGGLFKGASPDALIEDVKHRVRAAIVIGRDRADVVASFTRHAPQTPVFEVDTLDTEEVMPRVVRLAAEVASDGDVVLLAPAAASMDQFRDYADRGRRFQVAVQDMLGDEAHGDRPASSRPGD